MLKRPIFTSQENMVSPNSVFLWLGLSCGTVCLGWTLSLLHELYWYYYVAFYLIFIVICARRIFSFSLKKFLSIIFKNPIFFMSCLLLLVQGLSQHPSHDDGLVYRIPRMMHWIMNHGWCWAQCVDVRINTRGTTSEWLTIPLLSTFLDDRFVFLPNWISYLFLPTLINYVASALGVGRITTYYLMWLLPAGECFLLQSCNSSNDTIGATYFLAAITCAYWGRVYKCSLSLIYSIIAIALCTGTKVNLIPLVLPWLVIFLPSYRVIISAPRRFLIALPFIGLSSYLPMGILNYAHGAGFSGLGLDAACFGKEIAVQAPPPLDAVSGNAFLITFHNLLPPLIILPDAWQRSLFYVAQLPGIRGLLDQYFAEGARGCLVGYYQWPVVQGGLGPFTLLAIIRLCAFAKQFDFKRNTTRIVFCIALLIGLFHFCLVSDSNQPARLICSYYIPLILVIFGGRQITFQFLPMARQILRFVQILSLMLVLTLSDGALFNVAPWIKALQKIEQQNTAFLNASLPLNVSQVGVIRTWNTRESWIWIPYGSRRVIELSKDYTDDQLGNIQFIVVSTQIVPMTKLDSWSQVHHVILVGVFPQGLSPQWVIVKKI